jgi:hypothetical protein
MWQLNTDNFSTVELVGLLPALLSQAMLHRKVNSGQGMVTLTRLRGLYKEQQASLFGHLTLCAIFVTLGHHF